MKKFVKICLIIVAALVVLGIIFVTIGVNCGGIGDAVKIIREKNLKWITLREDAADALPEDFLDEEFNDEDFDDEDFDDENFLEDAFVDGSMTKADAADIEHINLADGSEVSKVKIRLGGCEFFVRPSEDGNYSLSVKDAEGVCYGVKDGTLSLVWDNGEFDSWKPWEHKDVKREIILSVPEGAKLDECDIIFGAGVVTVKGISTDKLLVKGGAGQIKMKDMVTKDADIKMGAGEFEYDGTMTGNLSADCGMGSMEIDLTGSREDHNYHIGCSMGEVRIGDDNKYIYHADHNIENNADSKFTIECSMGQVTVDFEESDD